jgi:hypothetical protein
MQLSQYNILNDEIAYRVCRNLETFYDDALKTLNIQYRRTL